MRAGECRTGARCARVVVLSLAVLMLSSTAAQAASTYWQNPGSGDWFVAANWSVGVPVPGYWVYVKNGGTALIGSGQAWAGSLYIGDTAPGGVEQSGGGLEADTVRVRTSGIYDLSAGTLGVTDLRMAGTSSLFRQTGGSATVAGKLVVSENIGENSVYALGGSGTLLVNQTTVGCWGSGGWRAALYGSWSNSALPRRP